MTEPTATVRVPPGWHQASEPAPGIQLATGCPETPPSGFTPSAVLTWEPTDDRLPGVQLDLCHALRRSLDLVQLEDADIYDLDGRDVSYVRIGHRSGGIDLIAEIWTWLVDGVAWSLTTTVALADYPVYCDLFEELAGSFEAA